VILLGLGFLLSIAGALVIHSRVGFFRQPVQEVSEDG